MPHLGHQVLDQVEHLLLDGHVQGRGGLVGDQQVGPAGQRHRDADALALAARELVRIGIQARGRVGNAHALAAGSAPPARASLWRTGPGAGAAARRPARAMVCTGFRAVIGSWKIMPMRLPRIRHMADSGSPMSSCAVQADAAA